MDRVIVEGWAVQLEVGLDFKGVRMWVFLKEEDEGLGFPQGMVAVWATRELARDVLRRKRRVLAIQGSGLKRRDGRVVRVRQVVEVVADH